MAKAYDQAYFDRWYRHPRSRLRTAADVARKVSMVLGIAEQVLERKVTSVLDVGCGEGTWQPIVKRLRPRASYTGIDSSEYAVRRFGRRRNIRHGTFGDLEQSGLADRYDVIVVCDVLHYLPDRDIKAGLASLSPRLEGVAFLEAYTAADAIDGDKRGLYRRSPARYLRMFRDAGLAPVGMHCYVGEEMKDALTALEFAGA
jgi:SAM-dependent methyltransferase